MNLDKDYIAKIIDAELEGNLQVLIDPKKKNSFSQNRVDVWKRLVGERIYIHLTGNNKIEQ
jgi:hypothetical protein